MPKCNDRSPGAKQLCCNWATGSTCSIVRRCERPKAGKSSTDCLCLRLAKKKAPITSYVATAGAASRSLVVPAPAESYIIRSSFGLMAFSFLGAKLALSYSLNRAWRFERMMLLTVRCSWGCSCDVSKTPKAYSLQNPLQCL
jgi:hypothetical protein